MDSSRTATVSTSPRCESANPQPVHEKDGRFHAHVSPQQMRRTNKTRAALRSGEWKIILNEFAQPWFGGINGMDEQGAPLSPGSGTNCGDNPGTMAHSYLFNLTDDPYEQRNLWDIRPDVAARLSARVFDLARHEAVSQWQAETQSAYQQWDMFGGVIRPWCDAVGDACDPPKWGTTPGSR